MLIDKVMIWWAKASVRKNVYLSKTICHVKAVFIPRDEPRLDSTQHSSSLLHELVSIYLMTVISSVQYRQVGHIALFGIVTCQS